MDSTAMKDESKLILAINAGSSSLKISLYSVSSESEPVLVLESTISSISSPPAQFSFKPINDSEKASSSAVDSIHDHTSAFTHFIHHLDSQTHIDKNHIIHVCHRIVHGGDYHDPVIINQEAYHHIEKLSDLAPLHNGSALAVIKSCIKDLPNAHSIGFFDTAFHRSIPPHISSYAIDQNIAIERGLKKYGFHGLSYAYILHSVSNYLRKPPENLNLIVLHLGSGASVCAIKDGKSLDTSMGLTPVSGLPGATRSGAIDPSLIFHYTNTAGRITHDPNAATDLHVTQAEDILNSKSGWKSLTGTTDFAEITHSAFSSPTTANAKLAFDIFADRIVNYIGSYHLKLRGHVDALVFSGGIGEKSQQLRTTIGDWVECLGYGGGGISGQSNAQANDDPVVDISLHKCQNKKILVCKTDEQFEMAKECLVNEQFW